MMKSENEENYILQRQHAVAQFLKDKRLVCILFYFVVAFNIQYILYISYNI